MLDSRAAVAAHAAPSAALLCAALGIAALAIVLLFWQTFASLVDVWLQSDTFAHCFVIAPITLFFVWRSRQELASAPKKPSLAGVAAVLLLSAAWYVASVANVQVGEQLAATMLIPAAVLAVLGTEATKRIAFPLGFLVFAVPFGEALIPSLMDFTASFTVGALRLTGIPVLREGFYFKIPSGDFEVAKACSGIRYLIACSTLGVLYSYVAFQSWRKRLIFIAVSIAAPIVANGIRAYLIVMIAHLSNMRLATGVDHLIYGWLFFGALVALLFWIGGRFQDPEPSPAVRGAGAAPVAAPASGAALLTVAVLTAVCAALGPSLSYSRDDRAPGLQPTLALPFAPAEWQGPNAAAGAWRKPLPSAAVAAQGEYTSAAGSVELLLLAYSQETEGAEVVGSIGRLVDGNRWQTVQTDRVRAPGAAGAVGEVVLRGPREHGVLWYWYVIGTHETSSDWQAELAEAWNAILHGRTQSTLVVLSAGAPEADAARAVLRRYLATGRASIDACAAVAAAGCVPAGRE